MALLFHFAPKPSDIGDNFTVRRSLPRAEKRMVGPFIFWDHMGPVELSADKEMKVRAHPHIGLATITYLFTGEILHRDSLNNEQMIRPGEVNWMTAGKGIVHSERAKVNHPITLEGIQLWVALPTEHEQISPSFVHIKENKLPKFDLHQVSFRLIAGKLAEFESPLPVYSSLFYANGEIKAGQTFKMDLQTSEAGVYIIQGKLTVNGVSYTRFDMLVFDKQVEFSCQEDCHFMLFGGEPFPEKRHIWWNFVASKKELIEQAKQDWRTGKFPPVVNESEWIPLPDDEV